MQAAKIVGIEGLDTRALTRHLREHGSQQGLISHIEGDRQRAVERAMQAPGIIGRDLAAEVTCPKSYQWTDGSGEWAPASDGSVSTTKRRWKVVAYDFGVKQNILRRLVDEGCEVTVVPASTTAKQVEALKPDGIFLSNGPGDPEGVSYAIDAMRQLIGRCPIFGICLGHQILGLALGLKSYKLKFGHHGANHPVKDLATGRVEITAQNHGFAVDPASVRRAGFEESHVNLNDGTSEGMRHRELPVFSVQYHPEASPGPHDADYLFDRFVTLMEGGTVSCRNT